MAFSLGKKKALALAKSFPNISRVQWFMSSKLPDSWDLATGVARWELVQYAKGNLDPFFTLPIKRGPGTKDCPNVIPSVYEQRLVGCHCNEDDMHIKWFWLHEGFPRRCECNYWFVLERRPWPSVYEDS